MAESESSCLMYLLIAVEQNNLVVILFSLIFNFIEVQALVDYYLLFGSDQPGFLELSLIT